MKDIKIYHETIGYSQLNLNNKGFLFMQIINLIRENGECKKY